MFALESILLWHEAGVIPLLSAGGSKFQNTMTEEGCAPWKWKWKCVFVLMLLQPTTCYDWLCVHASKHAQYTLFSEIHACVHLFAIIANVALYNLTMPYMASCNNRHISFLHLLSLRKADKILFSSTTLRTCLCTSVF